MTSKRSNIYNWERFSKPRVYSTSKNLTTTDDIQDWIKKVEDASSKAAAATFGYKYVPSSQMTKATITATVDEVRLHDAAYAEAQELLQQWVEEKIDLGDDDDFTEETWMRKTEAEIKREWDQLVGDDDEDRYDVDVEDIAGRIPRSNKDPYSILEKDDASLVDDVMQKLLQKQVVGSNVLDDLGLDNSGAACKDPRTKMKLRHQQVKENREKRERERKKKLQELQAKKDAFLQAKQIIKKEDQAKAIQRKREEEAIQREMAKIRKEMEEEKRKQRERKLREKKEIEQFEQSVKKEVNQQQAQLENEEKIKHKQAEYRQQLIMERLQELQTKEAVDNLKLLQKCFSAWYNIVVKHHLQIGKAKAMADWKLVLKVFNAWKSYTRARHIEKESLLHETEIKILQRKQLLAEQHYKSKLLRKCFLSWQLYVLHEQHKKYIESQKDQTKNKMAAFIQAASSGRLWSARSEKSEAESQNSKLWQNSSEKGGSTSRRVDELFNGPIRQRAASDDENSGLQSQSADRKRTKSGPHQIQAWQITRKHAQVTKEELAKIKQKNESAETSEMKPAKNSKKLPIINNYEHRHMAQQKILEMQQKQIKEQQRLIEEMQYLQKQQMLQQQLAQQQLAQQKCGWVTPGNRDTAKEQLDRADNNCSTVLTDLKIEDLEEFNRVEPNHVNNQQSDIENMSRTENKSTVSSARSKTSASNKSVNFLKTMEERAQQRARLKREREEKRRKAEEERIRALQAQEEERRKEEEAEKKRRAEAYKEKKRLEKQRELEKQRQLEEVKKLTAKAEEHRQHALVKYRGWLPWKHLVAMARHNMKIAKEHHQRTLLRKVLLKWHDHVQEDLSHKRSLADDMFNYILIRRCFSNWKKVGNYMMIQEQKAHRHFEMMLKGKIMHAWMNYAMEEKMAMWKKERLAKEHNTKRMVLTALRAWRRYPRMIKEEEERQRRLDKMRKKVLSILPDFEAASLSQKSLEFGS